MFPYYPKINHILHASKLIQTIFNYTPLTQHTDLSSKYNSNIYLKREDLTPVRSYKIRGAFNKMSSLQNNNGIVKSDNIKYNSKNIGLLNMVLKLE